MSETPAEEQDIRPVWYRVSVASDNEHDDGWAVTHSGTATVTDLTAWLVGKASEQCELNGMPVRVQVWDNPQCSGDPITETFYPATSVPWLAPPAATADPTATAEELPQRTPQDVPPPIRDVPSPPVADETLTKVRDGLKGDQPNPGQPGSKAAGPIMIVMEPPDDADIPEGLRELFAKARVNMERAAREAIREGKMIEAAQWLDQLVEGARKHAADTHPDKPWSECLQCLAGVSLAASAFTAAYILARTDA